MSSHFDTIVAPITASGGAVALLRLSGPESWLVASRVFAPWQPEPLRAIYGRYVHGDDGIALPFREGSSYTGEEAVELSIHGSPASMRLLVQSCLEAGARMAEPGEFTQRAFLNGRIDLSQAEAVRDSVEAITSTQLRFANHHRDGSLRREVLSIRQRIGKILAEIEATVDFSEEVGELDRDRASGELKVCLTQIQALQQTSITGKLLREGLRVAIIGPPNAGKSSLLNAILGSDRAIVTPIAGTTRDYVEERVEFKGVPLVLIDTAGLREAGDEVESIGISRSRSIAERADIVWYVYDASVGLTAEDRVQQSMFPRSTLVANKRDLAEGEGVPVSARSGDGLAQLLATLPIDEARFGSQIALNPRQAGCLAIARESVQNAIQVVHAEKPVDLVSVLLVEAMNALGEITGETASEDILDRIFADFCIGK